MTVSTSNFLIQSLLTTIHSFLYVQTHFRTFRTAITPSWNDCYDITNVRPKLYQSQMKRISGSYHFISSQIRLTALSLREMQVSFLFGPSARKCREKLWFDRKRFEIWLVNTGHVKTKDVGKLASFEHIPWYSSTKAYKYSSRYLFLCLSGQVVYFTEQIIVLIWVIIYSYLQNFFKIRVLKMLYTIQRKTTVSESLFNQPIACYFFNKRLRHRRFLVGIAKLSRTPFLQEPLETPDSVFTVHIRNYNNIKFNVN